MLGAEVPVQEGTSAPADGPAGVLVVAAADGGNGIVTSRTFLGATTRVGVLLSVDVPSSAAAAMTPVLVAERTGVAPGALPDSG